MVAAPMRLAILASFAKLSFRSQGEAGERSRRRPSTGRGSTSGNGTRGRPSSSARAEAELDAPARSGEAEIGELDDRLFRDGNGPLGREGGEVLTRARPLEQRVDEVAVAFEELRLLVAHRGCEAPEDLHVRKRFPERLGRLDLSREGELEVGGDEIVELEEARGRENVVGEIGRVRREEVDGDREEVLAAKRLVQPRLLRIRGGDVDVPAEERLRSSGIGEAVHERHVADRLRRLGPKVGREEVVLVDAA